MLQPVSRSFQKGEAGLRGGVFSLKEGRAIPQDHTRIQNPHKQDPLQIPPSLHPCIFTAHTPTYPSVRPRRHERACSETVPQPAEAAWKQLVELLHFQSERTGINPFTHICSEGADPRSTLPPHGCVCVFRLIVAGCGCRNSPPPPEETLNRSVKPALLFPTTSLSLLKDLRVADDG